MSAQTYYVTTSGSDANNGLTQATAFATLTHAAAVWNALAAADQGGSFIWVLPGTYSTEGQVYFQPKINSSGVLTVQCTTPYGATLSCDPTGNPNGGALYCVYMWSAANTGNSSSPYCGILFSGFSIRDRTAGNTAIIGASLAHPNLFIDQCDVRDIGLNLANNTGGGGIDVTGFGDGLNPMGITIQRCRVFHCGPTAGGNQFHGIYGTCYAFIMLNNLVGNIPGGYGLHAWHNATQSLMANNTVFNCTAGGIVVGSDNLASSGNRVYNNICYNNGGYGIRTLAGGTGSIDFTDCQNNCLVGNATAPTLFAGAHDAIVGTVSADPLFVLYTGDASGNYHIPLASPCVDAGTSATGVPSNDLDGNPRPLHGGRWDIGVYEYVPPIASVPQYTIRVRDHSLIPQGAFAGWTNGDIVLRMNDVGKWALTVRADDPLLQYFAVRGAGIIVTCDLGDGVGARTVMSGPVWVVTRTGLDNYYTLAGPTDEWWLAAREAMPVGGSPYMEVILDDAPTHYYRLDETSGTAIVDFAATNPGNGTYVNAPTLGVAGAVTGDPDTAVTTNGTTQRLTLSAANVALVNTPVSFEVAFKFAANPGANSFLTDYGGTTRANHGNMGMFIDAAGKLNADIGAGSVIISAAAVTTGVYHLAHLTWDGTSMKMYLDGTQAGATITPGAQNIPNPRSWFAGASVATANFFAGQLDEIACYNNVTLSAAQITAHYASFSATHAAYDARSGVASTTILAYVNANMIAPTNIYRALPGLVNAADPAIGTSVKGNLRDENLLAALQQLAISGGDIGFKLVQTANGVLTFSVYQPTDRSASIKFSRDFNNLFDFSYSLAGPIANSILVRGGGTLAGRSATRSKDTTSIAAWGLVEGVLDARDTSDVPTMTQRGSAAVQANTELTNLAVTPGDAGTVRYLVDYQLGDIISMVIDGNTITNKVRSVHIELKNPGDQEKITPGIGTPSQGDVAHWFDAGQARARALSLVQQKLNKLSTVV